MTLKSGRKLTDAQLAFSCSRSTVFPDCPFLGPLELGVLQLGSVHDSSEETAIGTACCSIFRARLNNLRNRRQSLLHLPRASHTAQFTGAHCMVQPCAMLGTVIRSRNLSSTEPTKTQVLRLLPELPLADAAYRRLTKVAQQRC